jgi:hypothetical protein
MKRRRKTVACLWRFWLPSFGIVLGIDKAARQNAAMSERARDGLIVAILVAVSFLAGFLTEGVVLRLTLSQDVLGIVSGAIGGLVVAGLIIWNSRARSDAPARA